MHFNTLCPIPAGRQHVLWLFWASFISRLKYSQVMMYPKKLHISGLTTEMRLKGAANSGEKTIGVRQAMLTMCPSM